MANYIMKQGEDIVVEIEVVNDLSEPIDISTATEIIVEYMQSGISVQKYSLNVKTGYGKLDFKPLTTNAIQILTTREESVNFNTGYINVVVLVEVPDVDLTNKRTEYLYKGYIQVFTGYLKSEVLN